MATNKIFGTLVLLELSVILCSSCSSNSISNIFSPPANDSTYTLVPNKSRVTLEYLQRDTLFIHGMDAKQIKWKVTEGDSCITMLENVVVARRKGSAKIIAEANGEYGLIDVEVTTEEYIRVDDIIFEIDGQAYIHRNGFTDRRENMHFGNTDTVNIFPTEKVSVKISGVKPENASCQYFAGNMPDAIPGALYKAVSEKSGKTTIQWNGGGWPNDHGYSNFKLSRPWDGNYFTMHYNLTSLNSYCSSEYLGTEEQQEKDGHWWEQEVFTYRIEKSAKTGIYYGHRAFVYAFPPDLQKSEWDKGELKSKLTEFEYETNIVQAHILYMTDNLSCGHVLLKNRMPINLKPGESQQLEIIYEGPVEYKEYLSNIRFCFDTFGDKILQEAKEITITPNGLISLSPNLNGSSFNDSNIGWQYENYGEAGIASIKVIPATPIKETKFYEKIKNELTSNPNYDGNGENGWFNIFGDHLNTIDNISIKAVNPLHIPLGSVN